MINLRLEVYSCRGVYDTWGGMRGLMINTNISKILVMATEVPGFQN